MSLWNVKSTNCKKSYISLLFLYLGATTTEVAPSTTSPTTGKTEMKSTKLVYLYCQKDNDWICESLLHQAWNLSLASESIQSHYLLISATSVFFLPLIPCSVMTNWAKIFTGLLIFPQAFSPLNTFTLFNTLKQTTMYLI